MEDWSMEDWEYGRLGVSMQRVKKKAKYERCMKVWKLSIKVLYSHTSILPYY